MSNLPSAPTVRLTIDRALKSIDLTKFYNVNSFKVIHAVAANQDKLLEGCYSQDDLNSKVLDFVNNYLNKGV